MYKFVYLFIFLSVGTLLSAQVIDQAHFGFRYGMDLPGNDLKERFGFSYNPELTLQVSKKNWFYGIHGGMFLGPIVKEDVISNLRTSDGFLVSQQQDLAIITMKQRGFIIGVNGGKFFPLIEAGGQHGIRARIGLNVLTHYIIFNNETASTNQLLGDYAHGYDRLSRGWGIEQFIGYQYVSNSGGVIVFAGINAIQARTKNLRPVNFDTRVADRAARLDMLTGFRVGFAIRLFEGGEGKEIYY